MNPEEARELLRRSIHEREEAERTVEQATATIESSRLIIRGLVRRYPELTTEVINPADLWEPGTTEERPKGTAEMIRSVLQGSPGEFYTVSELVSIFKNRGSLPVSENPANVIRTALERLIDSSESDIYKGKLGNAVAYCYDPDRERPAPSRGYGFDEEPF